VRWTEADPRTIAAAARAAYDASEAEERAVAEREASVRRDGPVRA
jgi:hypothetical protein